MNKALELFHSLPEQEFPFDSRFLEVGGHQIHYLEEGSGPTLLLVHAGPGWSFVFRDLIERLRKDFRCVTLDFPGDGLSQAAEGWRPSLELASDVLERFIITLGLDDIGLVAHDLGGPISFGVLARRPERFRALTVLETFGWPLGTENPFVGRMLRLMGSAPMRRVNGATNMLPRLMVSSYSIGRHLSRDGKRAFLGPYRDHRVRRNALRMFGAAGRADDYMTEIEQGIREALATKPVLVIYGSKSPGIKEEQPERWMQRFPDARLRIIEGAHHFPMNDDPDEVAGELRSWWREVVEPSGGAG